MTSQPAENQSRLIGLWDLSTEPFTLGGMFNLMSELKCQAEGHSETVAGVCLIWNNEHPLPAGVFPPASTAMTLLPTANWQDSAVVSAMMAFEGIDNLYVAGSVKEVRKFIQNENGNYSVWPSSEPGEAQINHEYPSTGHVQRFFDANNYVPRIKLRAGPTERAQAFLRDNAPSGQAVIVHIKSDSPIPQERDACINEWAEFIRDHESDSDTTFIAIGNDDVEPFRNLANVVVARDSGNDLPRDIALIQVGSAFMGLASGPAQLAILGNRPYAVFKPLNIHPEFMKREIGDLPGFPFATPDQYLFRTDPTRENLGSALDMILPKPGEPKQHD
jgi:hypothetical protein